MNTQCPGQDSRFWPRDYARDEKCPACGGPVEFFKDDRSRQCPACGARFRNPRRDPGCAAWCPHAAECLDYVSPEKAGGASP